MRQRICVTVQPGGIVRCTFDIHKAVDVTKGVKGVKSVYDVIILKGTQLRQANWLFLS